MKRGISNILTFLIRKITSKIYWLNKTEALVISKRLEISYDDRINANFIMFIASLTTVVRILHF